MSPEKTLPASMILEESARIANLLLAVEQSADLASKAERSRQLENIRAYLGYTVVDLAQTEDVVDTRISEKTSVITPESLNGALPLTQISAETTLRSRTAISEVLTHEDDRILVVVGPCSIHDPEVALDYADQVNTWRNQYGEDLEIVMRFYPEKPRTERGWKGFIYDPRLDGTDDINQGIVATRLLASIITGRGVPLGMERLNALTPQYVNGLVAYDAIGARNTTDQKAREYASGTSSPVGFKNTPEGSVEAAVQAVVSANGPHSFLGLGMNGTPNQISTKGNELGHIILRGSSQGPNYNAEYVQEAKVSLQSRGLIEAIGIDSSHGNSGKQADMQVKVVLNVGEQVALGESAIVMVMIESNLLSGAQKLEQPDGTYKPLAELTKGQSITDACSGLEQTELMLNILSGSVRTRRGGRDKIEN